MSELISIWNSKQLVGAKTLPPFIIPNNPNARSIKINNQCRYWLLIGKANTSIIVDRIEPFSHLVFPYEPDISITIDNSGNNASSLNADLEFVDYSTINGYIGYQKGSTQFSGSSTVTIGGSVNIGNSQLNVGIVGTPTFNIAAGNSITIAGTPTFNVGTMPAVTFAAGSTVQISGTPTMNIGTLPAVTIGNATLNMKLDQTNGNNQVVISGTPSVTITNSSINVAIQGTPTFNLGAGATVAISGTPTINVGTMPSVTIGNATLNMKLDQTAGNNTVVIGGTPNVTISNSSLNVAIQGTPTFNLGAGATVAISGTPTINVGTMPAVTFAAGSTVQISGTPTVNVGTMPSVTVTGGTINVGSANITNNQLPVTMLYNNSASFTYPTGVTTQQVTVQFLPNGQMIEFHRAFFYLKTANGNTYTLSTVTPWSTFADGTKFRSAVAVASAGGTYTGQRWATNVYYIDGAPAAANSFTLQLDIPTALTVADTVTIYYQIDGNDTAIETGAGQGVSIQPTMDLMSDYSGTITGTTPQQLWGGMAAIKYLFFQNLSSATMYINFGGKPGGGTPGDILIPPNGGSITYENGFVPNNAFWVYCPLVGAPFTCKTS
jgi:hypothetical protein